MAWSKLKPDDNVKIREMPGEIRANWKAIEENDTGVQATSLNQWVVHLIDRETIAGSNTPAPVDDTGLLYCRNDGATNELFFEDSANTPNEIQLTDSGKIGSPTTQMVAQDIAFSSVATAYAAPNIITAYGRYNSSGAGSTLASFGCSITKLGGTSFRVTFTTARSSSNYVVATVQNLTNFGFKTSVPTQTTTYFDVAHDSNAIVNFMVCGAL